MLRQATIADAADIARIYNHYIETSPATFEVEPLAPEEIQRRIAETLAQGLPWLVCLEQGDVVGYAYATPWRPREAYRFSAEITVYISPYRTGRGFGKVLYAGLLHQLRAKSLRTAVAGIALPNEASVKLHETMGMHKVAHFEAVGFKFDRWIDVGYWQLQL